jgi:Ca2+-transporting ATPase
MELCHLNNGEIEELKKKIEQMAQHGLRVLGIARADLIQSELPDGQHDFKFHFLGLIGLADPIRPNVPAAIKECYGAGIRVVMITGDYPVTAVNIAKQIGLREAKHYISGAELDKLSDHELVERLKTTNVFCRVVPEQKLRIVQIFKKLGQVAAMTGDGVNDAPALKAASIGIAMGGRGTDVAREASDMVLLDDDFSSIVAAIRMGRRIFDNLKKALAYTLAVHVPIAGLALFPVLLGWPLILFPVHVVFLELIIDPACSVVFEAEEAEKNIMRRAPRNPREPLFSRRVVVLSLLQGAVALLTTLSVYGIALLLGFEKGEARALTFATLIVSNLALILTNRSWSKLVYHTLLEPNFAFWGVFTGAFVFLGLAIYNPLLAALFKFSPLHLPDLLIVICVAFLTVLPFEVIKLIFQRGKLDLLIEV